MALTENKGDYRHKVVPLSMLSGADLMLARRTRCERTAPIVSVPLARSFRYGCRGCGALHRSWSPHIASTSCAHRNRAPNVGSSNRDSYLIKSKVNTCLFVR